jgi:peroxiredoxin
MVVKVGDRLKDFNLTAHTGKQIKLSELKGKKVLLSFHPLAWTSVCAAQMKALEADFSELEKLNTLPLGLSVDSVPCKTAWAKELGVEKTPLVADFWPHGGLAQELGIFREKDGISERANILVDENGVAAWVKVYPIAQLPDIKEVLDAIRKLGQEKAA